VPLHLKEPGHPGLKKLGFGKGYKYPHDYPGHRVEQEYLPARFSGTRYYEPSGEGEETGQPGEHAPGTPDGTAEEAPPV
jgi:putative ATPase